MPDDKLHTGLIASVKIAQKDLGLDDTTYRSLLQAVTGMDSAARCTVPQLKAMLAELRAKGWTPRPRNSESRAISYALKYIRRACPSVAWVQSYADERCQGLGVVYQACSFLYLGFHESPFYELDGEVYHKLLVTAHLKSGKRGAYLRANLDRAKLHKLRQFRYVRFLKTDWIKRLRMPILPYPKRQPD